MSATDSTTHRACLLKKEANAGDKFGDGRIVTRRGESINVNEDIIANTLEVEEDSGLSLNPSYNGEGRHASRRGPKLNRRLRRNWRGSWWRRGPKGNTGETGSQGPQGEIGPNDKIYYDGKVGIGTDNPKGSVDIQSVGSADLAAFSIWSSGGGVNICSDNDGVCWQSFKATTTGLLTEIKVPVCNTASFPRGEINLYEGNCAKNSSCVGNTQEGKLGTSGPTASSCDLSGSLEGSFNFDPPISNTEGADYTFQVKDVTA